MNITDTEPLPPFVEAIIDDGSYDHIRASLPTRDGRKVGNAVVLGTSCLEGNQWFLIATDAGNLLSLTLSETIELFHPPMFIMKELLPAHKSAEDRLFDRAKAMQ